MILTGDCLEVMKTFPDNHFSSIVTDPPYGLSFMGKGWDHAVPGREYWTECHRIVKPGGNLLAMGGTRTFHRLTSAIEDSGWEIRDCISWLYGSGFPKSHNHFGLQGYGTALKPAWEPCIVAMKPCDGTFKQNAEKWGQAGINVDGCRISTGGERVVCERSRQNLHPGWDRPYTKDKDYCISRAKESNEKTNSLGRWPANVILDEESGALVDQQAGFNASRFFKCIDKGCFLCYNPCTKAGDKECKNIHAPNVNQNLKTIQAINLNIVQKDASLNPKEQFAQNVKYAGHLCDLCATNIVRVLVEIKTSGFKKEELKAILDYIGDFKSSILIQNLAFFAELWENIDTIPTIQSLSLLFGSVHHAIENYIKPESHEASGKNEQSRFLYCPKASSTERNEGLDGFPDKIGGGMCSTVSGDTRTGHVTIQKNNHPTVKPLKLMEYLIKLVMPPKDGLLLDPFAGSGTTILAAKRLGFDAIGIEKSEEYSKIARARIEAYKGPAYENELF